MNLQVTVQYFAVLREQSGLWEESVETEAKTFRELYIELAERHRFRLPDTAVRVAANLEFRSLDEPISEGDTVVFIPPVAGG